MKFLDFAEGIVFAVGRIVWESVRTTRDLLSRQKVCNSSRQKNNPKIRSFARLWRFLFLGRAFRKGVAFVDRGVW